MSSYEGATPGGYFSQKDASYAGNAVNDLFSGFATYEGDQTKAQGLETEATNDTLAAELAGEEATTATTNMGIQEYQDIQHLSSAQGRTEAEAAGAGFENSGSTLDVLRSNAQQGAIQQAVTEVQGENQIAGYQEQQTAYNNLATYSNEAASSEKEQGTISAIGAGVGAAMSIAAMFVAA
jgi:hypothetical protein